MAKVAGTKRLLTISDIHLFHRKTPIEHMLATLNRYVFNRTTLAEVDAVLITGDLFDRWVKLTMGDLIWEWVYNTLTLCKETNTALRVLEGTPFHEWKQSKLLVTINETAGINADLIYVDELTIMDDPTLGMTIGYIPDEIRPTCTQIMDDLETMMSVRALDRLDLIMAHGFFDFQLPPGQTNALDTDRLSALVNYVIYCGHDHRSKGKNKVKVPGSWDRCAQGEEGAKGGIITDIFRSECSHQFLENPDAYPYITLDLTLENDESIIKRIETHLENQKVGYLRLYIPKETTLRDYLTNIAKTAIIGVDIEYKGETIIDRANDAFSLSGVTVNITEENILELIIDEIGDSDDAIVHEINYIKEAIS